MPPPGSCCLQPRERRTRSVTSPFPTSNRGRIADLAKWPHDARLHRQRSTLASDSREWWIDRPAAVSRTPLHLSSSGPTRANGVTGGLTNQESSEGQTGSLTAASGQPRTGAEAGDLWPLGRHCRSGSDAVIDRLRRCSEIGLEPRKAGRSRLTCRWPRRRHSSSGCTRSRSMTPFPARQLPRRS